MEVRKYLGIHKWLGYWVNPSCNSAAINRFYGSYGFRLIDVKPLSCCIRPITKYDAAQKLFFMRRITNEPV